MHPRDNSDGACSGRPVFKKDRSCKAIAAGVAAYERTTHHFSQWTVFPDGEVCLVLPVCSQAGPATRRGSRTASRTSITCSSRAGSGGRRRRTAAGEMDAMGGGGEGSSTHSRARTTRATTFGARRSIGTVAFDVIIDMLRNSRFEPEEIEREKGVIIEEMNMYFDTPRDYLGGSPSSSSTADQPLGWDIIGRKETVRGATRETFLEYLRPLVPADAPRRRRRRQVRSIESLLAKLEESMSDFTTPRRDSRRPSGSTWGTAGRG